MLGGHTHICAQNSAHDERHFYETLSSRSWSGGCLRVVVSVSSGVRSFSIAHIEQAFIMQVISETMVDMPGPNVLFIGKALVLPRAEGAGF